MTYILLCFVAHVASVTHADQTLTAAEVLAELGSSLPNDRVFYRWQTTTSGEALVAAGTLTPALNTHFMAQTKNIAAGPGFYLADSPWSSSSYLPAPGGNIIEARLPRGTTLVDLNDPEMVRRVARRGWTLPRVYAALDHADGVLVRYTPGWFVAKNMTERTTLSPYPGAGHTAADVIDAFSNVKEPAAREQLIAQVRTHRPELARTIRRDDPFTALSLRLIPENEVMPFLREHVGQLRSDLDVARVYELARERPALLQAIGQDHRLGRELFPKLLEGPLASDKVLGSANLDLLDRIAAHDGVAAAERRRLTLHLISRTLDHSPTALDLAPHVPRIAAWMRQAHLTESDRYPIAYKLGLILRLRNFAGAKEVGELLEAGGMTHLPVYAATQTAITRRLAFDRALAQRSATAVTEALRGYETLDDFLVAARVMKVAVSPAAFQTGAASFLHQSDGSTPFGHVKKYNDWRVVIEDLGKLLTADPFEATYRAALTSPEGVWFMYYCLGNETCAPRLARAMTNDGAALLRSPSDFETFARALPDLARSDSKTAAALGNLALRSARTPADILALGDLQRVSRSLEKLYLERIMAIGLDHFRAKDLIKLDGFTRSSRRFELVNAAIAAVANPAEAEYVSEYLDDIEAPKSLDAAMKQRVTELELTPAEMRSVNPQHRGPAVDPGPAGPDQCVNQLARLLH